MKFNLIYKINILLFVIIFWSILWFLYNRFIRSKSFHPMGKEVIPTPKILSCAIPIVSIEPKKNKIENLKIVIYEYCWKSNLSSIRNEYILLNQSICKVKASDFQEYHNFQNKYGIGLMDEP